MTSERDEARSEMIKETKVGDDVMKCDDVICDDYVFVEIRDRDDEDVGSDQ